MHAKGDAAARVARQNGRDSAVREKPYAPRALPVVLPRPGTSAGVDTLTPPWRPAPVAVAVAVIGAAAAPPNTDDCAVRPYDALLVVSYPNRLAADDAPPYVWLSASCPGPP